MKLSMNIMPIEDNLMSVPTSEGTVFRDVMGQ